MANTISNTPPENLFAKELRPTGSLTSNCVGPVHHTSLCDFNLQKNATSIECHVCHFKFHMTWHKIKSKSNVWTCRNCKSNHKIKCNACRKTIPKTFLPITCLKCDNKFHKKCANTNQNCFVCRECVSTELPFFNINTSELLLTVSGIKSQMPNVEILPSFSIKTLLDKLPGKVTIQTGDFTSDFINSKYYTPIEFQKKNSLIKISVYYTSILPLYKHTSMI